MLVIIFFKKMQSVAFVLDTEEPRMETAVTNVSHSLLEMLKVFKRQVSLSMQACSVYKRLAAAFPNPCFVDTIQ